MKILLLPHVPPNKILGMQVAVICLLMFYMHDCVLEVSYVWKEDKGMDHSV